MSSASLVRTQLAKTVPPPATTALKPAATVSVIVPTFNRAVCLRECLASLLAQTVAAHEIIVVDDGSEDGTASVVSALGGLHHHD